MKKSEAYYVLLLSDCKGYKGTHEKHSELHSNEFTIDEFQILCVGYRPLTTDLGLHYFLVSIYRHWMHQEIRTYNGDKYLL